MIYWEFYIVYEIGSGDRRKFYDFGKIGIDKLAEKKKKIFLIMNGSSEIGQYKWCLSPQNGSYIHINGVRCEQGSGGSQAAWFSVCASCLTSSDSVRLSAHSGWLICFIYVGQCATRDGNEASCSRHAKFISSTLEFTPDQTFHTTTTTTTTRR